MSLTDKNQIRHEIQIQRLLSEILDDNYLAVNAFFKGGTCARMLGFLDRFSVDLDFDLKEKADKKECRTRLYKIFRELDLEIKDESKRSLQFFLRYPGSGTLGEMNNLKLEALDKIYLSNRYEPKHIPAINRTAMCQTIDTMFAHKLIAPIDRQESGGKVAGRDIYDIHYFFSQGYSYRPEIIKERRGISVVDYFRQLEKFIGENLTRKTIEEDLNTLLDYNKFIKSRKYLKDETLGFIKSELEKLKNNPDAVF